MKCVFVSRLLHAISTLQTTLYQLSLAHLDHVGLLIRHVLELQMNLIFTNVFIEIGSDRQLIMLREIAWLAQLKR